MYIWLFVVLVLLPVLGVAAALVLEAKRRRRFAKRPILAEEEWFNVNDPEGQMDKLLTIRVLNSLGECMWVEPTQLAINDRFDVEFSFCPRWIGLSNRALKDFLREVAYIMADEGVTGWTGFDFRGATLRELLEEVNRKVSEHRGHGVLPDGPDP
jgi:hypothetical protein